MSHWSERYLGIPYMAGGRSLEEDEGLDCYGLVREVYRQQLGREIPKLEVGPGDGKKPVEEAFEVQATERWRKVAEPEAQEFDVIWASSGAGSHCGIALDAQRMLHTIEGHDASITRQECRLWTVRGRFRLEG